MPSIRKIIDLPVSGSGCLWARFAYRETNGTLEFKYNDQQTGKSSVGTLFFPGIMSFRFRDEMHSLGFYSESYDSVAEVSDSEWVANLEKMEPKQIPKLWNRRHFAAFLSSCGFFEVIADNCEFSSRCE